MDGFAEVMNETEPEMNVYMTEIVERIRKENPHLEKFKKVYFIESWFVINTIYDIFSKDITEGICSKEATDQDLKIPFSFKLNKKDFCCICDSFPFWHKMLFVFYNDEKKLDAQLLDKVFSRAAYKPGTYDLCKCGGQYHLSEIEVLEEESPELDENITQQITNDIEHFFKNKKFYVKNKLGFKRGILIYGPPGNGKSSTIKQILNNNPEKYGIIVNHTLIGDSLGRFLSQVTNEKDKIIVIEDIDSVSEYERSTFLNFLDGVEGLEGAFIIATTNYLNKLDPAICNRPSRFDKTYHFGVPKKETRKRIIKKYFKDTLDKETIAKAATASEGFSGAYIKELFIQCGIQGTDILTAIEEIKDQTKDYKNYKPPTFYG